MDVQIYECIKSVLLIVYTYLRCVSLSKAVMKPVDCPSTHWGGCGLQDCGDKNKHVSVIFYFKDVENSVYECVREKEIEREGMYVCITHKSHSLSTVSFLLCRRSDPDGRNPPPA